MKLRYFFRGALVVLVLCMIYKGILILDILRFDLMSEPSAMLMELTRYEIDSGNLIAYSDTPEYQIIMLDSFEYTADITLKCDQLVELDKRWMRLSVPQAEQASIRKQYIGDDNNVICEINDGSFDYVFFEPSRKEITGRYAVIGMVDIETGIITCYKRRLGWLL